MQQHCWPTSPPPIDSVCLIATPYAVSRSSPGAAAAASGTNNSGGTEIAAPSSPDAGERGSSGVAAAWRMVRVLSVPSVLAPGSGARVDPPPGKGKTPTSSPLLAGSGGAEETPSEVFEGLVLHHIGNVDTLLKTFAAHDLRVKHLEALAAEQHQQQPPPQPQQNRTDSKSRHRQVSVSTGLTPSQQQPVAAPPGTAAAAAAVIASVYKSFTEAVGPAAPREVLFRMGILDHIRQIVALGGTHKAAAAATSVGTTDATDSSANGDEVLGSSSAQFGNSRNKSNVQGGGSGLPGVSGTTGLHPKPPPAVTGSSGTITSQPLPLDTAVSSMPMPPAQAPPSSRAKRLNQHNSGVTDTGKTSPIAVPLAGPGELRSAPQHSTAAAAPTSASTESSTDHQNRLLSREAVAADVAIFSFPSDPTTFMTHVVKFRLSEVICVVPHLAIDVVVDQQKDSQLQHSHGYKGLRGSNSHRGHHSIGASVVSLSPSPTPLGGSHEKNSERKKKTSVKVTVGDDDATASASPSLQGAPSISSVHQPVLAQRQSSASSFQSSSSSSFRPSQSGKSIFELAAAPVTMTKVTSAMSTRSKGPTKVPGAQELFSSREEPVKVILVDPQLMELLPVLLLAYETYVGPMGRIPLPCSSYYSTVAAKKPPENPSRVIDDGSVPSLSPHPTSELLPPAATWSEQGSFVARRLTRPVIQAFLSTQENSASSCHSSSLFQLCSIDVSFFAREFVDKDADDLAGVMVDNAPTLESVKISAICHPLLHTDLTRIVDETEASATHIARRKMFAKKASPITNASISSLRSCDPSVSAATKSTSSKDNDARTSGDGLVDGAAAVSLPDDDGRRCTSPPPRFAAYLGESMSTSGVDALLAAAKRWLMLKAYMSLNTSSALPSVPRPPLLRLVLRNLHIDEKQLYEVGLLEMPAFGQLQLLDLSNNRNIGDEFLSRVLSLVAPAAFPDPLSVNQAKRSRTHGRNDQCATTRISFIPLWQHSPAASPPVSLQALMLCGNKITDHGACEIQRTFLTDTTSSFNAPCLRLVDVRRNKITGLCKETVLAPISVPSSLCGWSRRVHSSCDQRVRRRIILVWCVMQARALQAVERAKEHRAAQGALEEDSHTKAQQQLLSRRRKRVAQGEAVSDAEHLLYSFASFLSPFNRTHPISVLF